MQGVFVRGEERVRRALKEGGARHYLAGARLRLGGLRCLRGCCRTRPAGRFLGRTRSRTTCGDGDDDIGRLRCIARVRTNSGCTSGQANCVAGGYL